MRTDLSNFSKKYRVVKGPEARFSRKPEDLQWLWQIPCTKAAGGGHIYTHSETYLGFLGGQVKPQRHLKRKLQRVLGRDLHQEGDEEWSIVFPVEDLAKVAKAVGAFKALKPRKPTKSQLAALAAGRRS